LLGSNNIGENSLQEMAQVAIVMAMRISEKLQKFNVLKLIEGYRTRGHLFTKKPVKRTIEIIHQH
jgi:hypothetical protein